MARSPAVGDRVVRIPPGGLASMLFLMPRGTVTRVNRKTVTVKLDVDSGGGTMKMAPDTLWSEDHLAAQGLTLTGKPLR